MSSVCIHLVFEEMCVSVRNIYYIEIICTDLCLLYLQLEIPFQLLNAVDPSSLLVSLSVHVNTV